MKLKFLNPLIIRKILLSKKPEVLNCIAKIISLATGDSYEDLKNNLQFNPTAFELESECSLSFSDGKTYYGFDIDYGRQELSGAKVFGHISQLIDLQLDEQTSIKPIKMISLRTEWDNSLHDELLQEYFLMTDDGKKYVDFLTIYGVDLLFFENLSIEQIKENELLKELLWMVTNDDQLVEEVCKDNKDILFICTILKILKSPYRTREELIFLDEIEL